MATRFCWDLQAAPGGGSPVDCVHQAPSEHGIDGLLIILLKVFVDGTHHPRPMNSKCELYIAQSVPFCFVQLPIVNSFLRMNCSKNNKCTCAIITVGLESKTFILKQFLLVCRGGERKSISSVRQ